MKWFSNRYVYLIYVLENDDEYIIAIVSSMEKVKEFIKDFKSYDKAIERKREYRFQQRELI